MEKVEKNGHVKIEDADVKLVTDIERAELRAAVERITQKRVEHSVLVMQLTDVEKAAVQADTDIRRLNEMYVMRLQEISKAHGAVDGNWFYDVEKGTFTKQK